MSLIRLFNDTGSEPLTVKGREWAELTQHHLGALIGKAIEENISLRDLTTMVLDEMTARTAEERLRRGIADRKSSNLVQH